MFQIRKLDKQYSEPIADVFRKYKKNIYDQEKVKIEFGKLKKQSAQIPSEQRYSWKSVINNFEKNICKKKNIDL